MGFKNSYDNNFWESNWFSSFILVKDTTLEKLVRFIYDRGVSMGTKVEASTLNEKCCNEADQEQEETSTE